MLDFGFSEILLTSAIALVVLGPERLPKVARQVGNWMGRARAMARQLSEQLEREVSAEELLKERSRPKAPAENHIGPPQGAPPQNVLPDSHTATPTGPHASPSNDGPLDPPPTASDAHAHYEPPAAPPDTSAHDHPHSSLSGLASKSPHE